MKEENQFLSANTLQEIQSDTGSHPSGNMVSFMYVSDASGNITATTSKGWDHIGVSDSEVTGSNACELFSINEQHLSEALSRNFSKFESTVAIKGRQASFEHIVAAHPQRSNDLLCISTDITRQKQKEKSRQEKLSEAEARIAVLEKECEHKNKILSIVAHDLRSPLTSLSALLSVLDYDDMPEELRPARAILEKQLDAVGGLVNNLLGWAARSFDKEVDNSKESVNIYGIVKHNIDLQSFTASEKKIQLINNVPDAFLANVNADQIDIVIRNLLLNAVKFTPIAGTITFDGTFNADSIELTITDTGVGMTKAQLDAIFTSTHATTYGTQGEKGFGLGLLLCKEYLDVNKGTISVSSKVNAGTVIKVTLPVS